MKEDSQKREETVWFTSLKFEKMQIILSDVKLVSSSGNGEGRREVIQRSWRNFLEILDISIILLVVTGDSSMGVHIDCTLSTCSFLSINYTSKKLF